MERGRGITNALVSVVERARENVASKIDMANEKRGGARALRDAVPARVYARISKGRRARATRSTRWRVGDSIENAKSVVTGGSDDEVRLARGARARPAPRA